MREASPPLSFGTAAAGVAAAAALLSASQDILAQRVTRSSPPPPWLSADPSTLAYLSALPPAAGSSLLAHLRACPATTPLPPRLAALVAAAAPLEALFPLRPPPPSAAAAAARPARRVSPRKHAQIHAVAAAVSELPPARRVVDVGGGHGHLSGLLAGALGTRVVCVDRDRALLATGAALCGGGSVDFVEADAFADGGLGGVVRPGDVLVALHACGALGDEVVRAAVRGSSGVVLVNCCLQKLRPGVGVRRPLSVAGGGLLLERGVLGLANRVRGGGGGSEGVRVARVALRIMLERRGVVGCDVRDVVHGVSRHRLRRGLGAVAGEIVERMAVGGGAVSAWEVEECEREAREEEARMRALALPRNLLGEVMEMAVALDRAAALEECGRFALVKTSRMFGEDISMRNIAVVAH